jgi:hypothetical protein
MSPGHHPSWDRHALLEQLLEDNRTVGLASRRQSAGDVITRPTTPAKAEENAVLVAQHGKATLCLDEVVTPRSQPLPHSAKVPASVWFVKATIADKESLTGVYDQFLGFCENGSRCDPHQNAQDRLASRKVGTSANLEQVECRWAHDVPTLRELPSQKGGIEARIRKRAVDIRIKDHPLGSPFGGTVSLTAMVALFCHWHLA